MEFMSTAWWSALLAIVLIDLVLAGDNAIVIALAARSLAPHLRKLAIVWGTVGAIVARAAMTAGVVWLLMVPGLLAVGGAVLLWIALRLLAGQTGLVQHGSEASNLWDATKTIIVADALMGIDNVLGVAGAAHGEFDLVLFGLLLSVPIMVFGSALVLRLVDRFPIIIWLGAAVLAYTAARMIAGEPLLNGLFGTRDEPRTMVRHATEALCVALVLGLGWWRSSRARSDVVLPPVNAPNPAAAAPAAGPAAQPAPAPYSAQKPLAPPLVQPTEGVVMEKIILYVDDAQYAHEHLSQCAPDTAGHGPRHWVLVGCPPHLPRHAGKWVTHEAVDSWHEEWFAQVQAELVPLLQEAGGSVTPVLAHGPLAELTQKLKLEHGAARVVDARRPKIGVDLEAVAPDHLPPAQSGWAVPGAVVGLGALLILAKELLD